MVFGFNKDIRIRLVLEFVYDYLFSFFQIFTLSYVHFQTIEIVLCIIIIQLNPGHQGTLTFNSFKQCFPQIHNITECSVDRFKMQLDHIIRTIPNFPS